MPKIRFDKWFIYTSFRVGFLLISLYFVKAGKTPILLAIGPDPFKDPSFVEFLVQNGANVNAPDKVMLFY